MLNQLLSNISWGQRGNFLSIPTDTPARDERLGWTGDISVFAPTANYLSDTRAFLTSGCGRARRPVRQRRAAVASRPSTRALRPERRAGRMPSSPCRTPCGAPTATRTSSGENYAAMQKFFELPGQRRSRQPGAGPAAVFTDDWLHLDDPTASRCARHAYFAEDARDDGRDGSRDRRDAEAAEYAALSAKPCAPSPDAYVALGRHRRCGTQTGYALALGMDLVTDRRCVTQGGREVRGQAGGDRLPPGTGFIGTPWLLPALTQDRPARPRVHDAAAQGLPLVGLRDRQGRDHDLGAVELDHARRLVRRWT